MLFGTSVIPSMIGLSHLVMGSVARSLYKYPKKVPENIFEEYL
jgi:hypothetical protein